MGVAYEWCCRACSPNRWTTTATCSRPVTYREVSFQLPSRPGTHSRFILTCCRADIKGAFEALEQPKIPFTWAYEPIWASVPQDILDELAQRVRCLFPQDRRFLAVRDTFVEIAYMAHVTGTATRTQTMQQVELSRLIFSHFYLVQCLLTCSGLLTSPQEFLRKTCRERPAVPCSADDQEVDVSFDINSFEEALRIAGLLFFKLVKGGSREKWDQHVSHLWLLNSHLRRIVAQSKAYRQKLASRESILSPGSLAADASEVDMLRSARGLLIWVVLIGEAFSAASEAEAWQWPSPYTHDHTVYRDVLAELLECDGSDTSVDVLPERELDFCHIFHLGIMKNFVWNVRAEVRRVLQGKP